MSENQLIMSVDDEEINIMELISVLWNNILKILLFCILGAILGFVYAFYQNKTQAPLYRASASLYANYSTQEIVDLSDLHMNEERNSSEKTGVDNGMILKYQENSVIKDYEKLLTSRELLETVIMNLNLDYTANQLKDMVKAEQVKDTRIIGVTVTNNNPELAAEIANELLDQSLIYLPEIMHLKAPQIIESALIPTTRINIISYPKRILLGGIFGGLLYCAYLTIRFILNDKISTSEEMIKYLSTQPIGIIPDGK